MQTADRSTDRHPPQVIVSIGEILWDLFPDGPRFGGAPANFARSCSALSRQASVMMASAVGQDELGELAIAELTEHEVNTSLISKLTQPTGTVNVSLDGAGSASYEFAANCAWDNLVWSADLELAAMHPSAVCFGTLSQRTGTSRATIQRFIGATPQATLRIFDVNLRPPHFDNETIDQSLRLANVVKLNDEELTVLAETYSLCGSTRTQLESLAERFELEAVALTRGPDGAAILKGNKMSEHPGIATKVADTVGAGDAFAAALTVGLLEGRALNDINQSACEVAAFVCSQQGAAPRLPQQFRW